MKTFMKVCSVVLVLALAVALCDLAQARVRAPRHHTSQEQTQGQQPAATQQPREIRTEYFSLPLTDGWTLLKPVRAHAGSVDVILGSPKKNGAIAINVMKANMSAAEIAGNMRANMQKDGATVGELTEKDGLQEFDFTRQRAKGRAWVGANGKAAAVVTIFGEQEMAKEVLKKLEPKAPGLFPKF